MAAVADRMVILGHLGAPWGIKGWIKVDSFTDPPAAILNYPVWQVARADGGWEPVRVVTGRPQGTGRLVVAGLEGVGSPEDARRFVGRDVAVPRSELPAPKAGEYYWEDLLGCRVATVEGVELGGMQPLPRLPGGTGDGRPGRRAGAVDTARAAPPEEGRSRRAARDRGLGSGVLRR